VLFRSLEPQKMEKTAWWLQTPIQEHLFEEQLKSNGDVGTTLDETSLYNPDLIACVWLEDAISVFSAVSVHEINGIGRLAAHRRGARFQALQDVRQNVCFFSRVHFLKGGKVQHDVLLRVLRELQSSGVKWVWVDTLCLLLASGFGDNPKYDYMLHTQPGVLLLAQTVSRCSHAYVCTAYARDKETFTSSLNEKLIKQATSTGTTSLLSVYWERLWCVIEYATIRSVIHASKISVDGKAFSSWIVSAEQVIKKPIQLLESEASTLQQQVWELSSDGGHNTRVEEQRDDLLNDKRVLDRNVEVMGVFRGLVAQGSMECGENPLLDFLKFKSTCPADRVLLRQSLRQSPSSGFSPFAKTPKAHAMYALLTAIIEAATVVSASSAITVNGIEGREIFQAAIGSHTFTAKDLFDSLSHYTGHGGINAVEDSSNNRLLVQFHPETREKLSWNYTTNTVEVVLVDEVKETKQWHGRSFETALVWSNKLTNRPHEANQDVQLTWRVSRS